MSRLVGQIQVPGGPPQRVTLTTDREKQEYDSVTVTTTSYTVKDKRYVLVDDDTAGGAVTITLPAVIENTDRVIDIKKLGTTGTVTIDGNGSETIDGSATLAISTQYDSYTLLCDGTEWWII